MVADTIGGGGRSDLRYTVRREGDLCAGLASDCLYWLSRARERFSACC